jgi:hypothetical protein
MTFLQVAMAITLAMNIVAVCLDIEDRLLTPVRRVVAKAALTR